MAISLFHFFIRVTYMVSLLIDGSNEDRKNTFNSLKTCVLDDRDDYFCNSDDKLYVPSE